jgi:hypothetical protein
VTIIRIVVIASLVGLLAMVLYIPSATPPERFLELIRTEHAANQRVWGEDTATRILQTAMDLADGTKKVSAAPEAQGIAAAAAVGGPVDAALAAQVGQMTGRLFNNAYFRSIDTLFLLATFRLAGLMQVIPVALAFAFACTIDGLVVRVVRSKEFIQHNPEVFATTACLSIILLCSIVLATVLPVPVPPLYFAGTLIVSGYVASRTIANFHRRG